MHRCRSLPYGLQRDFRRFPFVIKLLEPFPGARQFLLHFGKTGDCLLQLFQASPGLFHVCQQADFLVHDMSQPCFQAFKVSPAKPGGTGGHHLGGYIGGTDYWHPGRCVGRTVGMFLDIGFVGVGRIARRVGRAAFPGGCQFRRRHINRARTGRHDSPRLSLQRLIALPVQPYLKQPLQLPQAVLKLPVPFKPRLFVAVILYAGRAAFM